MGLSVLNAETWDCLLFLPDFGGLGPSLFFLELAEASIELSIFLLDFRFDKDRCIFLWLFLLVGDFSGVSQTVFFTPGTIEPAIKAVL